eukprot:406807-Hanusia_phi.AAC.3
MSTLISAYTYTRTTNREQDHKDAQRSELRTAARKAAPANASNSNNTKHKEKKYDSDDASGISSTS